MALYTKHNLRKTGRDNNIKMLFLFKPAKKTSPQKTQENIRKNVQFCCQETTSCNEVPKYRYVQYWPCSGSTVKSKTHLLCKPKRCSKNWSVGRCDVT
jgi:hypothetical protein